MKQRNSPFRLLAPLALALLWSCGDSTGPGAAPERLVVISGGAQSAPVGDLLPFPVVVEVRGAGGRALPGIEVTWTVTSGGGSVASASTRSGSDGRAQVGWRMGTAAGAQTLNAAVSGVAPVTVTAAAAAGAPASAEASGSGQTGTVGLPLSQPVAVLVRDTWSNPVPGAAVTFTPAPGSGTVSPATAVTNASGVAQTTWTLGTTLGPQSLTAVVSTLPAVPQQFTAVAAEATIVNLQNDVPLAGLAAASEALTLYRITVPPGTARLVVTTAGGSGDADLFLRHAALPTPQTHTCSSTAPATTESCTITAPAAGDWFILLHAWSAYSGVTLRAATTAGGTLDVAVSGLPAAVADVTITGPDGYRTTINGPRVLGSLLPGNYVVSAGPVLHSGGLYSPVSASQGVSVVASETRHAAVSYTVADGSRNLRIGGLHITQATQTTDGALPLIAGRGGLLRVFTLSNQLDNSDAPAVRVRLYHNGTLVDTRTIPAPSSTTPVLIDPSVLLSSWNLSLSPTLIRPGLSILADIDPDDVIAETDEDDNFYPVSGTALAPVVQSVPVHRTRFVPVLMTGNGQTGDVNAANMETYLSMLRAVYPLGEIDADVRATYTFTGLLGAAFTDDWSRLLGEIRTLRDLEGSGRHYYGVIRPNHTNGAAGLGYLTLPAAIGVDWLSVRDWVMAHEVGHNFGRRHAPCGNPGDPDAAYPYADGRIGLHGWDIRTNILRSANDTYDVMSYCLPGWASDYTYEGVRKFRGTAAAATQGAAAGVRAGAQPSLLVWGRISPEGLVLEPAFEVNAPPVLPTARGDHQLEILDAAGRALLELSFSGDVVDHMDGVEHFSFVVPLSSLRGGAPGAIRLRAAGREVMRRSAQAAVMAPGQELRGTRRGAARVQLEWDAARHPVLLVRDARTGHVISFARGGDADLITDAAELDVHVSDGVRSAGRRLQVGR